MNPLPPPVPTAARQAIALAGWLLLGTAAAATGALVSPGEWFAQLAKPAWNPPAWVFGPVWTTLYVMMAVAAWLLWISLAAALFTFWRAHRFAAALLIPYLAWVSFAAALNFTIWRMNA